MQQQQLGPKASTQYLSKVDIDHSSEPQNIPYSRKCSQNNGIIIQQDQQPEQQQQQQQQDQDYKEQPKEKSLHEQQKEQFEQEIQNLIKQIKECANSNKWKESINKKGFIGYKIEDCQDNEIFNKGVGIIQAPIKDVLDILFDLQNVEKGTVLNKYLKFSHQLVEYTPEIKIFYNFSSPPIISDLYSIILQGTIKIDETTYMHCVKSVDLPEGVPTIKYKKAKLTVCPYQGWIIKQDPNDNQKTNLEFISHILGDGMPGFIKKSIRNNRGHELISNLSEYIYKQNKKKK